MIIISGIEPFNNLKKKKKVYKTKNFDSQLRTATTQNKQVFNIVIHSFALEEEWKYTIKGAQ